MVNRLRRFWTAIPGFGDPWIEEARTRCLLEADAGLQTGYWIGIQIDPKNGALSGGANRRLIH